MPNVWLYKVFVDCHAKLNSHYDVSHITMEIEGFNDNIAIICLYVSAWF